MESTFVNISLEEVTKLRDDDAAVQAIHCINKDGEPISFNWLRKLAGRDRNLWKQLGRGTSVLASTELLDQYLYSYGLMIACQWEALTKGLTLTADPVRLVDYGCGQGLAGLLLYDRFGDAFAAMLKKVVLVEPSSFALVRAEAVYRSIAPAADIICVKKGFDELSVDDLMAQREMESIHIFSNVLDIDGFDQFRLFGEMMTDGSHSIMVVSPHRDFDGGTERIQTIKAAIENPANADVLKVSESQLTEFSCGPGDKWAVVTWHARLDVFDG